MTAYEINSTSIAIIKHICAFAHLRRTRTPYAVRRTHNIVRFTIYIILEWQDISDRSIYLSPPSYPTNSCRYPSIPAHTPNWAISTIRLSVVRLSLA